MKLERDLGFGETRIDNFPPMTPSGLLKGTVFIYVDVRMASTINLGDHPRVVMILMMHSNVTSV